MSMSSDEEQIKNSKFYSNHPFDEAVDVQGEDDIPSYSPSPRQFGNAGGSAGGGPHKSRPKSSKGRVRGPENDSLHDDDEGSLASLSQNVNAEMIGARSAASITAAAAMAAAGNSNQQQQQGMYGGQARPSAASSRGQRAMLGNNGDGRAVMSRQQELAMRRQQNPNDDDDADDDDMDDEDDDDEDDDEDENNDIDEQQFIGAYNPGKFENLQVGEEVKDLFKYITRYQPANIDLDHRLKCFIPNFIPSVGDIDAFIKVPRPDGKPDGLGLLVLDEPSSDQSDPTILHLKFRQLGKQSGASEAVEQQVRSIDNANKNLKLIDNWVSNIRTLHRERPPTAVHYSRNMPDIDTLMQEWPPEFEHFLKEGRLPTADLDCDLPTYVDLICGLMDIPVSKSRIQSLHVLFSLYWEFKNSTHFQNLAEKQGGAV